jgi:ketosteroid isomerase-like protein
MSQENVEIVRAVLAPLDGINGAEVVWDDETLREMLGAAYSPDIELRTLESGVGTGVNEVYRGLDGLVEYLRGWLEPFSEYHVQTLDYIEDGDRVIVPTRQWGIGRASGARVELRVTLSYELQDGKITRVFQYDSVEDALEAAGLRE